MADAPPADPPKDPPADPPKDPPKDSPKDPPENSAEARVKKALEKAAAAEAKLAEYEAGKKTEEDEKAKKRGEHERLIKERDEQLAKLTGEHKSAAETVAAYEKAAKEQIDAKLAGIKDEKKREALVKILGTRPILEQFAVLDDAISLVGGSSDFGGATLAGGAVDKDAKKKRYAELLNKANPSPSEQAEFRKLMTELSEYANGDKGAFDSDK